MKQTLHKKGGAWGSTLMIVAALLATVLVGLLASTPATAQSTDPLTGCSWADAPECAHAQGFDTASPTANPSASSTATANPGASPTPTATPTAPSTTSAAQDQYKEVPDTATVSPTATASPTASATATPSATASPTPTATSTTSAASEATAASPTPSSLPETSGFSAPTLITLAAMLALVGGGFAAWRLYKG